MKTSTILIELGILRVVTQGPYKYVRISVYCTNRITIDTLYRTFGGNKVESVWYAQDIESLRGVINCLQQSSEIIGNRHFNEVLTQMTMYCNAHRGQPRTYTAQTLSTQLRGDVLALSEVLRGQKTLPSR